jgi:predicted lipoprotein with Yx(FWY)xxD motif
MKTQLLALGVLVSLFAATGCGQDDVAAPTLVQPDPEVATTPNEAASQEPVGMPETMPATPATTTPGLGVPVASTGGATLTESQTAAPGGGTYLVDRAGTALYMLEGNGDGSRCTGACLEAWPPLLVGDTQPNAAPSLQASMVGSIKRPDGAMQITYNNHPLHRYAADTGRGRTAGHGVRDQWGEWHLLTPQGEKVASAQR